MDVYSRGRSSLLKKNYFVYFCTLKVYDLSKIERKISKKLFRTARKWKVSSNFKI